MAVFLTKTTSPRISANGLSREIYFRPPTSTRTTAVRREVLLQDVGVCGGRRNLDQIGGVNPCVLVALRHGFSSLPYCFNSCNVYGRSSSCRRRLWSKLAAFEDSTTPNVPVVQGVVLQDAGEDEELPNPTSENGSSIASFAQEKVSSTTGYWSSLPPRYKLVLTTSLAMVICNMDKVNFCCKTDGHHGVICCVCFFSCCVFCLPHQIFLQSQNQRDWRTVLCRGFSFWIRDFGSGNSVVGASFSYIASKDLGWRFRVPWLIRVSICGKWVVHIEEVFYVPLELLGFLNTSES